VTYLYVELFVLLMLSFLGGCAVAGGAVRLLVRRTADDVTPYSSRVQR
jgi:hypothetical protein